LANQEPLPATLTLGLKTCRQVARAERRSGECRAQQRLVLRLGRGHHHVNARAGEEVDQGLPEAADRRTRPGQQCRKQLTAGKLRDSRERAGAPSRPGPIVTSSTGSHGRPAPEAVAPLGGSGFATVSLTNPSISAASRSG
jgi:hypothetical protein